MTKCKGENIFTQTDSLTTEQSKGGSVFEPYSWKRKGVHIPFFGQVFQSEKLMVLPFGVLASEFSVEAKNISRFAGECREFFAKISKGGPKGMKILNEVPP